MMALLLSALLTAAPAQHGSLLDKLKTLARRLYEKPDPVVAQGNALAAQNDAAGALEKYDEAAKRLPDDGALLHDRATTLLKLGAEKAPEALTEAGRALEHAGPALKPLAAYDQAQALEALGKPDEAMAAYARTLQLDPDDADAKVNLELLLKGEEQKKQQQQQQGQPKPDQKPQQSKPGNEQVKGKEEQQQKDKSEGEKEKERKQEQEQQQAGPKKPEDKKPEEQQQQQQQQQAGAEKPVDRTEAQRLLDALKAGEKNLQVWRFAKQKKKDLKRGDVEKDW